MKTTVLSCFVALLFCSHSFAVADSARNNFLVISDIHLDSLSKAAMQINPDGSDILNNLDETTFATLLEQISTGIDSGKVPKPQFIIFLGDMIGNYIGCDLLSNIITEERKVFTRLKKTFPGIPIFYTFGNHDSTSGINKSFYSNTLEYNSPYQIAQVSRWDDGFLSRGYKYQIGGAFSRACLISEDTKNGYYAAYVQQNLRLIVLNTTMLWESAIGTTTNKATAQFNWFAGQMQSAEKNGDSVLIAMHVPFGNSIQNTSPSPVNYLAPNYNARFLDIISKYNDIIIGMVGGHEHLVELKVLTKSNNAVNFLINVPALAT